MTEFPPAAPLLPPFTRALGLSLVIFAAFLALGSPVQLMNVAFGVWFTELVVFLGVAVVLLRAVGVDPVRSSGLDSVRPSALGLGFVLGLVNYLAWAVPLMALAQMIFPRPLLELYDAGQLFQNQTPLEQVLLLLGVSLAAPLCEEFFFRGVVQPGLMARLSAPRAIVVTALLFSFFHLDPVGFLARFELGVLFGLLAWRSGSVWPGIAAHAANNVVASALYLATGGGSDEEASLGWPWVVALLVAGNLGLLLLARLAAGRLRSPRPAEETTAPRVPLWRGGLTLGALALASLGAYLALDWRGAMVRSMEAMHPLPPRVELPPELVALRARARAGQVPVQDYLEARSLLGPAEPAPGERP